jgi:hypothetical protein
VVASLSPSDIIGARGLWDSITDDAQSAAATAAVGPGIAGARRRLAASMLAAAAGDVTASIGPFATPDAGGHGRALAYAAAGSPSPVQRQAGGTAVAVTGSASVVNKAIDTASNHPTAERLSNPWMRGVMLVPSVQNALVVSLIGDPDYTRLVTYMHKPASAVLMTFSGDPNAGLGIERFSGSAVVFPVTVSFGPSRLR